MSTWKYKVPTSAFYKIKGELTTYRDTGSTRVVANPDRRWWMFWRPKTVVEPIFEVVETKVFNSIYRLDTGDQVQLSGNADILIIEKKS